MASKLPETAVCLGCAYCLRGLPENVCPECGRSFHPSDPSTYRDRRVVPKWRRWAKAPPIWQIAVIVALVSTIACQRSVPGARLFALYLGYGLIFIPLAGLFVLGSIIDYFVRVAAAISDRERARDDGTQVSRRGRWRWAVTPLAMLLIGSVIAVNWPLRLRFHWSHAAFQRAAAAHLAGTGGKFGTQVIGLYRVERIDVYRGLEVRFQTGWDFGNRGFTYHPADPRPTDPNRLAKGWHVAGW